MAAQVVFLGSDDEINITILNQKITDNDNPDGTPIPFILNGVTSMKLFNYEDDSVLADSSVDDKISYDDVGNITVKLGSIDPSLVIKGRSYSTYIKSFSDVNPLGQTLVHPKRSESKLSITFA
jgi:hypothetical protein